MKHLKKSHILLMLLTVIIVSRTFAQDLYTDRGREVMQDNEYSGTGYEQGKFFYNPLLLNGKPLDYNVFSLKSKGELMVIKGSPITGETTKVPFYVYLKRYGVKVFIPDYDPSDQRLIKINLSEILQFAKPGDLLVIEPVNKEDGPAKRVLKLFDDGC